MPKILLDDPVKFFKKEKENVKEAVIYLASLILLFVVMNEVSVRAGFARYQPLVGPFRSIIINYVSLLAGFLICVLIIYAILHLKKDIKSLFFILVYSSTPLMLLG